jgi:hypothetical protein
MRYGAREASSERIAPGPRVNKQPGVGPPSKNLRKDRTVTTLKEKVRTRYEGRKGLKDLGGGRPRYIKKSKPERMESAIKTYRKSTGLEILKRISRSTVGLK